MITILIASLALALASYAIMCIMVGRKENAKQAEYNDILQYEKSVDKQVNYILYHEVIEKIKTMRNSGKITQAEQNWLNAITYQTYYHSNKL